MPVVVAAPPEHISVVIRKARNPLSMLLGDVYEAIEVEEDLDPERELKLIDRFHHKIDEPFDPYDRDRWLVSVCSAVR
jgi:hypothetical protein